jgi:hypothetical protein
MATRMQQRRGTAQQWTTANPILAAGEIGFESGTNKFKIGDGVNTWSSLTYYASASEIAALVDGAPDLLNTLNELAAAIGDDANFGTAIEASINTSVDEANTFTTTAVSNHRQMTQAVHGIADTSLLATTANVASAKAEALTAAATAANAYTDTEVSELATAAAAQAGSLATAAKTEAIADAATDATTKANAAKTAAEATASADATSKANAAETAANTYTDSSITTHNNDTTGVHGIEDTALLATKAYADQAETDAVAAAEDYADGLASNYDAAGTATSAVSSHNALTTNVHGISDTSLLALKSEVAAVTATTLGLGNVTNTSDANKPVSTAQASAIATAKAEAISDATSQVNALLSGAPAALNTLDELAAALGDDANFAASVTTNLGLKVDSLTPISQKSASYTLSALTERDDLIEMGSASAMTLTIPSDATLNFPIGTSLDVLQTSTGQVTIAGAGGVTVNATPGLKLRTQWSSVTLMKRAANTWVAFGDLTA